MYSQRLANRNYSHAAQSMVPVPFFCCRTEPYRDLLHDYIKLIKIRTTFVYKMLERPIIGFPHFFGLPQYFLSLGATESRKTMLGFWVGVIEGLLNLLHSRKYHLS